jgi:hypothetical protein
MFRNEGESDGESPSIFLDSPSDFTASKTMGLLGFGLAGGIARHHLARMSEHVPFR